MIGAYAIVALALFLMGVLGGFIAVISLAGPARKRGSA